VTFQFNRWLLPKTAIRQSVSVAIAPSTGVHFTEPHYDLLNRTVTYRAVGGLTANLVYVLKLLDSSIDPGGFGFKAYDESPLDRDGVPEAVYFRTKKAETRFISEAREKTTCREALRAFSAAGCTSAQCHRGSEGESSGSGLRLDTKNGLSAAIGKVARATDRGGDSGRAMETPPRFGINLPLIDAGEPSNSFLLYRILLGRDAYRNDTGDFEIEPISADELEYATTWFGAMGPMPPTSVGFPEGVSPVEVTRTIEKWIADGADTDLCE
jgi:hypothetical protein